MNEIIEKTILLMLGIIFVSVLTTVGMDIINQGKETIGENEFDTNSISVDIMVEETATDLIKRTGIPPDESAGTIAVWIPKDSEKIKIKCSASYAIVDLTYLEDKSSAILELKKGIDEKRDVSNIIANKFGNQIRLDISFKTKNDACRINSYTVPDGYKIIDLTTNSYFKLDKRKYDKNILNIVGEKPNFS